MGLKKKKGEAGEAILYIPRTKAVKLLQITLRDFQRLCIQKGIYPRVPKHRKRAQGGDTSIKTLFLRSDIKALLQEPIIWKIREEKIRKRKLKYFKAKKEWLKYEYLKSHPVDVKIDHMVLERYPTLYDALRDLDDALNACFLQACLYCGKNSDLIQNELCRKLTLEFMRYIIETNSLRKAFVTLKGYYYRAEIHGIPVTWIAPHPFPINFPHKIEKDTLKHSIKFYTVLLTFINFKLFKRVNIHYPPPNLVKHDKEVKRKNLNIEPTYDLYASLNAPCVKSKIIYKKKKNEDYDPELLAAAGLDPWEAKKKSILSSKQKELFKGLKFFLGRETNRESLLFVILSAGGEVSWDASLGLGCTYQEDDISITHQIVDRPSVEKKCLRRYYIQPQWVYDSFNFSVLMPVQKYFFGSVLPPHMSPFEETYDPNYVPPELAEIYHLQRMMYFHEGDEGDNFQSALADPFGEQGEESQTSDSSDDEEEQKRLGQLTMPSARKRKLKQRKKRRLPAFNPTSQERHQMEKQEREKNGQENANTDYELPEMSGMRVRRGKVVKLNLSDMKRRHIIKEEKLKVSLIHKRQKGLYHRLVDREKQERQATESLKMKRKLYDKAIMGKSVKTSKTK